jgi:hypothetical protein
MSVAQCFLLTRKLFHSTCSDTLTEAAKKTEGSYLYFDPEEAVWIRSGKVCGRSFAERHKEHKTSSHLKCDKSRDSRFYTHYPSKTATTAASAGIVFWVDAMPQKGTTRRVQVLDHLYTSSWSHSSNQFHDSKHY